MPKPAKTKLFTPVVLPQRPPTWQDIMTPKESSMPLRRSTVGSMPSTRRRSKEKFCEDAAIYAWSERRHVMSGRCIMRMLTASPTFTTKPRTCEKMFAAAATSRRRTPGPRLRLGVKDALDVHVRVRRGHRPRLRVRIGVAEDGVSGRHLGLNYVCGARIFGRGEIYCCVSRRVFERGRAATARRRGRAARNGKKLPSVSATADRRPSHARPAVCEYCHGRRGFSPPKKSAGTRSAPRGPLRWRF